MALAAVSADEYQQLTQVQHVLLRPGMYLGPVDRVGRNANCLDFATKQIRQKQVLHAKAQEQTFKEIFGNAGDNVFKSRRAGIDPVQVEMTMTPEWVTVKNYGRHIAVGVNTQTGKWAPEMIFGNMLSGSNFDDTEDRLYIGQNGIGAKATNIYSRAFKIRCADPVHQLLYEQLWEHNMSVRHEPTITQYSGPGFTEISYMLDFARFGIQSFDQEALEIYGAHAASFSYVCQIPVVFNGERFEVSSLVEYAGMFFPVSKGSSITYQDPNGTYDLCLIDTPDAGISVSFVNGMITESGGVHVDAAYKVVVASIIEFMGKAIEGIKLTKRDVVNHVSVFIACRLNKPQFNAQVKDQLKSPEPKIELPPKLIEGIRKWKLIEILHNEIQRKQTTKMNKAIGGGGKKRGNWGKAEPANAAGTKESHMCTYILTEGDSADSYRLKFISHVPNGMGREYYGSQPLRGKLPNSLNADFIQILKNEELMAICHNINIKPETDYSDPANYKKLHYGRVLVFPDPDNDGKHVLGLVLLFFMIKFPSLVARGFVNFLRIPTVRCVIAGVEYDFYSVGAFKRALASLPPGTPVGKPDYFKGLGTSKDHHIKKDFQSPRIVTFMMDEKAIERTLLAFHKTQANQRKHWISDWVNRQLIEIESIQQLPISVFIDHELIDYSIENIIRSIPEAVDGMKESQRKALFAAMKKLAGGKKEMVVERIANHAAEITNYKHGAGCLAETIIMMTQFFVGSNNLPFFTPGGQFGSRNKGGKDSPNPRYPKVGLQYWIDLVYRPEDKRLEELLEDEGEKQECKNFLPTLPVHVMNGERGIGTAWSTNIPSHHPLEVAFWFQQRAMMDLDPQGGYRVPTLKPWFKGFTGAINMRPGGFTTEGRLYPQGDGAWVVDELPIGYWTHDFEEELVRMQDEGEIDDWKTYSTDTQVKFVISGYKDGAPTLKKLKLISKHSYKNMTVLYRTADRGIRPQIYSDLNTLLEDFYKLRLTKYQERKALQLSDIQAEIHELNERARYIHLVAVSKELEVRDRPERDILADMDRLKLDHKWLDKVKDREKNKDRIPALYEKVQKKITEKQQLEQTRPEAIYYREIEEFVVSYCRHEGTQRSSHETINPPMMITLS